MSKNKETGLVKSTINWLADFIPWIKENLQDSEMRRSILLDLGLDPDNYSDPDLPAENMDSIERYRQSVDPDELAMQSVLNDIEQVYDAIKAFLLSGSDGDQAAGQELIFQFFNAMSINYLRLRQPGLYWVCQVLGFISEFPVVTKGGAYALAGAPMGARLICENIWAFLSHPIQSLKNFWRKFKNMASYSGPIPLPGLETQQDAQFWSYLFFGLAGILTTLEIIQHGSRFRYIYGWDPTPGNAPDDWADIVSKGIFSFDYEIGNEESNPEELKKHLGGSMLFVPAEVDGGPGLLLSLNGDLEMNTPISDDWELAFEITSGDIVNIFFGKEFDFNGPGDMRIRLSIQTRTDPATGKAYSLPDEKGSRLEIGKFAFSTILSNTDQGFVIELADNALVLSLLDLDNFLKDLLSTKEYPFRFSLAGGYNKDEGFFLKRHFSWPGQTSGSSNQPAVPFFRTHSVLHRSDELPGEESESFDLSTKLNINQNLGLVTFESLDFDYGPDTNNGKPGVSIQLKATLISKIGPVYVRIEKIGLTAGLYLPGETANLLLADLQYGFLPPTGAGLFLDVGIVKGGGFLDFNYEKGEYTGVAYLEVLDSISIKALGVVNTKVPGGGYSFILLVSSEFNPVPLGFGFMLEGVGGIIGIHRGLDLENIRKGIKDGNYDKILFPEDPVGDVRSIMTSVNRIVPVRRDHYAFGIMGRITWGTPVLLEIKAGLMFEVPDFKMAIIGHARAEIARGDRTLVRLQLPFSFTYNPNEALLTFDGSLDESTLLGWELTGDMAMRIRGGDDPYFLLSFGGFHSDFKKPAGLRLPKLNPLRVTILEDNPNVYIDAFFAITANTLQFGGSGHASYSKLGLTFEADLGFEALIQFVPLYFTAKFWGRVSVHVWGGDWSLGLRGNIEGPYPLKIALYVEIDLWLCTKTVRVPGISIGSSANTELPAVKVWPIFRSILLDKKNWLPQIPDRTQLRVTVRNTEREVAGSLTPGENRLRMHPIGALDIDQGRVPLNLTMQRFGHHQPEDYRKFAIKLKSAAGRELFHTRREQFFAPSQYFTLKEEEKFSRKSFEKYNSGIRVDDLKGYSGGSILQKQGAFEEIILDTEENTRRKTTKSEVVKDFRIWLGRPQLPFIPIKIELPPPPKPFAVVERGALEAFESIFADSEGEAWAIINALTLIRPELEGLLDVIPSFELELAGT